MDASIASISANFPPQAIAAIWSVALSAIVASMTWLFRAYDTARKSRLSRHAFVQLGSAEFAALSAERRIAT